MRRFTRAIRERKGAAAVEFAICAPIFFLLVFGIFEYSRYVFCRNMFQHAAAMGCRAAAVADNLNAASGPAKGNEIRAKMIGQMSASWNSLEPASKAIVIEYSFDTTPDDPNVFTPSAPSTDWWNAAWGDYITVRVQGNYRPILWRIFGTTSFPISVQTTMFTEGE